MKYEYKINVIQRYGASSVLKTKGLMAGLIFNFLMTKSIASRTYYHKNFAFSFVLVYEQLVLVLYFSFVVESITECMATDC